MTNSLFSSAAEAIATTEVERDRTFAAVIRSVHSGDRAYTYDRVLHAILEPITVWVPADSTIRYVHVELEERDHQTWAQGDVLVVTDSLFISAAFHTSSNVYRGPVTRVLVQRRADVRNVQLVDVSAPDMTAPNDPWPFDGELLINGVNGLSITLPFLPRRSAELWKILPELMPV